MNVDAETLAELKRLGFTVIDPIAAMPGDVGIRAFRAGVAMPSGWASLANQDGVVIAYQRITKNFAYDADLVARWSPPLQ